MAENKESKISFKELILKTVENDDVKNKCEECDEEYFSLNRLKSVEDSIYRIAISERGPGKTYACLMEILTNWIKKREKGALIRRWDLDIRNSEASTFFNAISSNGEIEKLTQGEYNNVFFKSGMFYLSKYDEEEDKVLKDDDPFLYVFALNTSEHKKSTSYPDVTTIFYDEFISSTGYLQNEFVRLMNLISTIKRRRSNCVVYLMANTISKSCPYFNEFGLRNAKFLKPGDLQVYKIGETGKTIAIEFPDIVSKMNENHVDPFFCFDNSALAQITGADGGWELDEFPHLPVAYDKDDIRFKFFIKWEGLTFQANVIKNGDNNEFIYIHNKTTDIKDETRALIYSTEFSPQKNYNQSIFKPRNRLEQVIGYFFNVKKVFYQDNDIGSYIRDYLNWCKTAA